MSEVCKNIDKLLQERGISGVKMSDDLGMSRSFMTELRKGRAKSIKIETAQKIADYFGVTTDFLFGKEIEKAPTPEGERNISDGDMMFALWGDSDEMDQADLDDVKRYADYVRERKRKK